MALPRARRALRRRVNLVDLSRRSLSYEARLIKVLASVLLSEIVCSIHNVALALVYLACVSIRCAHLFVLGVHSCV